MCLQLNINTFSYRIRYRFEADGVFCCLYDCVCMYWGESLRLILQSGSTVVIKADQICFWDFFMLSKCIQRIYTGSLKKRKPSMSQFDFNLYTSSHIIASGFYYKHIIVGPSGYTCTYTVKNLCSAYLTAKRISSSLGSATGEFARMSIFKGIVFGRVRWEDQYHSHACTLNMNLQPAAN